MSALPPAPAPEPPVANAAWVTVPSWRWRLYVHPGAWVMGIGVAIGSTVIALLGVVATVITWYALSETFASSVDRAWAIAGTVVVGAAVMFITWLACRFLAQRAMRGLATSFATLIPRTEPARGLMLAEVQESGPPRDAWSAWHAMRWIECIRAHGTARVFVARGLDERVRAYDRTDRPVEPEEIGGGVNAPGILPLLPLVGVALAVLAVSGPGNPVVWIVSIAVVGQAIRLIRRRALMSPVIAGQGWVQHGNARWTSADSVLWVSGWPLSRVRIVGPPGVLTLRLRTARQGHLELLWTRWTHPHPNLDQRAFDA